jgi:hypothetical protein
VQTLLTTLILKGKASSDWSFRLMGLALVLTAGLFLIVAGFSQEQMAGMMGLLGSAAGYILGKDVRASGVAGAGG